MAANVNDCQCDNVLGMSWAVRLVVRFPMRRRLQCPEARTVLAFQGCDITLRPVAGSGVIDDAEWLSMYAAGFDSRQQAHDFGVELKSSVRLAAVRANFGLDVGDQSVLSWPGEPVREAGRAMDGQLHETVHGLQVVETADLDRWMWSRAELTVKTQLERLFDEEFSSGSLAAPDGSKLALACDLFASVDFELSERARFIALVTAVETLAVDRYRIAEELGAIVDRWLAHLTSPPEGVDRDRFMRFRGRVSQIKQESITNSVRQLVEQYVPGREERETNGDFMASCYDVRSKLVHGSTDVPDVGGLRDRLRELTRKLIVAVAAGPDP